MNNYKNMPIQRFISFNKLLQHYDELAKSKDHFLAAKAKRVLDAQAPYPELREGFQDLTLLDKHKDVIDIILEDTFSDVLSTNEIKAATWPYDDLIFYSSKRFQNILKNAGPGYQAKMRNQEKSFSYIMAAAIVLNVHYGFKLDFSRPYFYDIPDAKGIMRHYRILYNADFMEFYPTDKAKKLTQSDFDELLENYNDIDLWKEKIPPGSFISKGFVISTMFDVSAEHSISEIKSALISNEKKNDGELFMANLQENFRTFFKLKDIKVGLVSYNDRQDQFELVQGVASESVILGQEEFVSCDEALCPGSYKTLLDDQKFYIVTDVKKYFKLSGGISPYKNLNAVGYQSAILAPIAENGKLLGVLEIGSPNKNDLNSVTATKLEDIMPYIVTSVQRSKAEEANLIDAIIQHECTSVHSSVYWKFQQEAKNFIKKGLLGEEHPSFNEIVFENVSPLYGQIDIKDSSNARNIAIQRDLMIQLADINSVLSLAWNKTKLPIYEELIFRVNNHLDEIKEELHADTEQAVSNFVLEEVNPVFDYLKKESKEFKKAILEYDNNKDEVTHSYYDHRKNYDTSVTTTNKKLAQLIDKRQEEAQLMFPHYFERYKTDGIEHNMYIGESITKEYNYNPIYLNNLRLWQLQVMCDMENRHYRLKPTLPVPLDVASLILVYNASLSIRFRMDEKQFDVDGTYNARYEVVKKRIDKSYIKGSNERLTQTGKMVIVYSQKSDELEYLRYIKFLRSKGYFTGKVEIVELEGLQGVSGLKAIRAEILYKKDKTSERTYTYEDLLEELKS